MINNFLIFLRHSGKSEKLNYQSDLYLDCANGVGAIAMREFNSNPDFFCALQVTLVNDSDDPILLNVDCGAEHVKNRKLPAGWDESDAESKYVSFDGDADRIIYFYGTSDNQAVIIDGDKQFALIMQFITKSLRELNLEDQLSSIFVQTAYCNSRSTNFIVENQINTQLVKTGVKYAHRVTVNYDIGANAEPNGHGTVAFKPDKIDEVLGPLIKEGNHKALKLKSFLDISNRVVGDSIANLLMIEAILYDYDMSIQQFATLYEENPSKLYKAVVRDRTKFQVIDDESRLTQPIELQYLIDQAVSQVENGKAFVRPSGTEDILRLYAEAKTMEQVEMLGSSILQIIETQFKNY